MGSLPCLKETGLRGAPAHSAGELKWVWAARPPPPWDRRDSRPRMAQESPRKGISQLWGEQYRSQHQGGIELSLDTGPRSSVSATARQHSQDDLARGGQPIAPLSQRPLAPHVTQQSSHCPGHTKASLSRPQVTSCPRTEGALGTGKGLGLQSGL